MASSRLDQLVKGAPPPEAHVPFNDSPAPIPKSYLQGSPATSDSRPTTPDPLSTLPSSPPQIYLNLLILESSLRAQYLALRERRRQNTFFLLLLALWNAWFFYALFMRPREDGGVGGSVYWMVETAEKVAFMGGIVTGILVWGTGQWERGMRWPRRWFAVANRGLRVMNTKIVLIRGPWWKELLSLLAFIFPYASLFQSPRNFQYVEMSSAEKRASRHIHHSALDSDSDSAYIEEDLAPGGDYIRLLLLPKAFSPEFRENWDEYRADYWEKENERRTQLRRKLRERERQRARQEAGWLWWLPFRWSSRLRRNSKTDLNSQQQQQQQQHHRQTSSVSRTNEGRARRNTRSNSQSLHHRGLSRSSTPESGAATPTESLGHKRKKSTRPSSSRGLSPLAPGISKRDSTVSVSSTASDDSFLPGSKQKRNGPEAVPAAEA